MNFIDYILLYLFIGLTVDIAVNRGLKMPDMIMMILWPFFLVISFIIISLEELDKIHAKGNKRIENDSE